jgi:RNA polymerase primary sigma factor
MGMPVRRDLGFGCFAATTAGDGACAFAWCNVAATADRFREDPARNLHLVTYVAKRYLGRGLDLDDLAGAGAIGLVKACLEFDPARGNQFSTCAYAYIRTEILAALGNLARPVRIPWHLQRDIRDGLGPESPGLSESRRRCLASARAVLDSSRYLGGGCDMTALAEIIPDHRPPDDPAAGEPGDFRPDLGSLPEREADVLRLRFGLDGANPSSLSEIGAAMGFSKERARQLQDAGLRRLRIQAGVPEPPHRPRADPAAVRPARRIRPSRAQVAGECPGCGTPYGATARCYRSACSMGKPAGRRPGKYA